MSEERYSASAGEADDRARSSRAVAARLTEEYWDRICLYARNHLSTGHDAEDIAQETIRVVLEALDRGAVREMDALPAFVFRTARNLCLRQHRSERRTRSALSKLDHEETDLNADPLRELLERERDERVRDLISDLGDDDRHFLHLFYVDGLTAQEVGRRLSISQVAARVRKHRLMSRIAALLRPERNEPQAPGTKE